MHAIPANKKLLLWTGYDNTKKTVHAIIAIQYKKKTIMLVMPNNNYKESFNYKRINSTHLKQQQAK